MACNKSTIESKGASHPHLQRRSKRHRSKSGAPFSTSCSLILLVASSSSAFVPSHHRHVKTLTISHASSSSSVWSEVFQNAVGILDRRLDSKEENMEKQRRRDGNNDEDGDNRIQFVSPLLDDGYLPAVLEYERTNIDIMNNNNQRQRQKPMLLYLPGFDGTILAPFLQFPSLSQEFDVRAMKIDMDDRSSFEELKEAVTDYLLSECRGSNDEANGGLGVVYLMGESFGGILATEVALELNRPTYENYVELRGLILVNPATSYLRSSLYELGPPIASARPLLPALSDIQYVFSLATKLVPLFLDEGRGIKQLLAILSSKGLPSVVNNPQREAYMGRVAFDLASRLKFMPKDTLKWRLEEWLEWGCGVFEDRLQMLQSARDSTNNDAPGDAETYALLKVSQELRTLIVAGELDLTLPSLEEADRLTSELFRNAYVHVVPGAGHASTCGGSLNLIQLIREVFPEIDVHGNIENNYGVNGESMEELHGLEPRYDGASIGLNPLLYWSKDYYRKWRRD